MSRSRRRKKSSSVTWESVKNKFIHSQIFPLILILFVFAILFVLFRMKTVELDYQTSAMNKDIKVQTYKNKELKAEKARLLSVGKLRKMAKKHKMIRPKQEQIIVVP